MTVATSPERAARVVISNIFSDDNRGGAAITAGTIETLRTALPGCRVSLVTVTDRADERDAGYRHTMARYPDVELLPPLIKVPSGPMAGARAVLRSILALAWPTRLAEHPTVDRIREASMVVGKGGQVFSGNRKGASLAGFWLAVFPLVLGRRLGTRTAVHAITVGPYPLRSTAGRLAGWVLRRADLVLVRDARSYREARALGVAEARLEQVPDVVFTMDPPDAERSRAVARELHLEPERFGVVTITTSKGANDLELFDTLGAVVKDILGQGLVDDVVTVLQTDGPGASDRVASEAFVRRLDDPRVRLMDRDLSPEDLIALYGAAAFTLGCRLHSTLFSVIAGTPAFPVSRATTVKADDIFETLGLDRFVVRLEEGEEERQRLAQRLAADIASAVSEQETVRDEILAAAARLRDRQEIGVTRLRRLVEREEA